MFTKGQSGNPSGRPRVNKELQEYARRFTKESIDVLAEIMRSKTSGASTRVSAANALLDRGYGKPVQPIDGDGEGGRINLGPLEIVIVEPKKNNGL